MTLAIAESSIFNAARLPSGRLDHYTDLELHRTTVFNHLRRLLYRPELINRADDLTQETYLRAWRYIEVGKEVQLKSAKSWLLRIATRVFLDDVRMRKRRIDALELDAGVTDSIDASAAVCFDAADRRSDSARENVQLDAIRRALRHLPDVQRSLLLEQARGADQVELAAKFNIPVTCVRSRLHRARELATYYGILEGVVEFDQLTERSQAKVLARVTALSRKLEHASDPLLDAEIASMLDRIGTASK